MSIQIKDQSKLDNLHNLYLRDLSEKISATIKEDQELSYCMGYDAGVRVTCENFQTQLAEAKRANETLNKELIESKDCLYTKQLEWARENSNLRFNGQVLRAELLKTDTELNSTCLLLAELGVDAERYRYFKGCNYKLRHALSEIHDDNKLDKEIDIAINNLG